MLPRRAGHEMVRQVRSLEEAKSKEGLDVNGEGGEPVAVEYHVPAT
jgi:hypothetical protein